MGRGLSDLQKTILRLAIGNRAADGHLLNDEWVADVYHEKVLSCRALTQHSCHQGQTERPTFRRRGERRNEIAPREPLEPEDSTNPR
jgi:hypothetical protein